MKIYWDHSCKPSVFVIKDGQDEIYRGPFEQGYRIICQDSKEDKKVKSFDCPECGSASRVNDVRYQQKQSVDNIHRRRICENGHLFSTSEILHADFLKLKKFMQCTDKLEKAMQMLKEIKEI